MFRGCGHSFHIQCVLPDISCCPICKTTLFQKLDVLGKTANDAVLSEHCLQDDGATTSDEESDSDDDDEEQCDDQADDGENETSLNR